MPNNPCSLPTSPGAPCRRALRGLSRSAPLLLLLVTAGCATKGDIRSLQEMNRELHAQSQALLRQVQENQRAQGDSVRFLSRDLIDFRAESLRRMTGVEDLLLRIQELSGISQQRLAELRDQIERDRAQAALGAGGAIDFGGGGTASGPEATYDAAVTQFRRGSNSSARIGFQDVIERFPQHMLAPEARFYLAEILVVEGDPNAAIASFLEIPQFHPNALRVPDALYRAALLYLDQDRTTEARELLQRIVGSWPESGAASLARDALTGLQ